MSKFLKFRLMAGEEEQTSAGGTATETTSAPATNTADPLDSAGETVNWGSFADDNFGDTSTVEGDIEVKSVATETKPAVAPATTTPTTEPAQTTAPAQPAETPAVQQPATTTTEITQTPATAPATEGAPFSWEQWEADTTTQLASQYELSDDEATAMLTEPETVLPKMAASVHARVIKNVLQQLPAILPQLIAQTLETQKQAQSQHDVFFKVNDDLADAKFANAIQQAGQVYRQLNPNADTATAAFAVGNMVRVSMGLPVKTAGATTAPAQAQTTQPTQTRTQPFTPAQGGSGGAVTTAPDNPFSQLAEEFLNTD